MINQRTLQDVREPWLSEAALSMDPNAFDNYTMFRILNIRLDRHLSDLGVRSKLRAASVGVMTLEHVYEVHTKIITSTGNFTHKEPLGLWPSAEFSAKLLMVAE